MNASRKVSDVGRAEADGFEHLCCALSIEENACQARGDVQEAKPMLFRIPATLPV